MRLLYQIEKLLLILLLLVKLDGETTLTVALAASMTWKIQTVLS